MHTVLAREGTEACGERVKGDRMSDIREYSAPKGHNLVCARCQLPIFFLYTGDPHDHVFHPDDECIEALGLELRRLRAGSSTLEKGK